MNACALCQWPCATVQWHRQTNFISTVSAAGCQSMALRLRACCVYAALAAGMVLTISALASSAHQLRELVDDVVADDAGGVRPCPSSQAL